MLGGIEIEIDEDGFIQEPAKWNKDVAEDLAKTENASPMSEEHWKLVNYLRDYYVKFGIAPPSAWSSNRQGSISSISTSCFQEDQPRRRYLWGDQAYPNQRAAYKKSCERSVPLRSRDGKGHILGSKAIGNLIRLAERKGECTSYWPSPHISHTSSSL